MTPDFLKQMKELLLTDKAKLEEDLTKTNF